MQQPLVSLLADGHNNAKLGQCDNTIAAIEDCADMDNPREQQQQEYIYTRWHARALLRAYKTNALDNVIIVNQR